jgi:glycosyltransferase involved in cell wall biosynthesis
MHIGSWGDGELDLRLYRDADMVIALTHVEEAFLLENGIPGEKITVLGHGVNVRGTGCRERFRGAHGITGPTVLFLGRKADYKGYSLLLQAAPAVWQEVPEARFVLVGPEDDSLELSSGAVEVLQDKRVHSIGYVSDAEREDAYAGCDVFCLPSSAEAFGLVYLEAWAYGKPVVALAIPTLSELIGSTGGGILVERDEIAVAKAIVKLITNAAIQEEIGETGHRVAETRSWTRVAGTMDAVYHQVVARVNTAAHRSSVMASGL